MLAAGQVKLAQLACVAIDEDRRIPAVAAQIETGANPVGCLLYTSCAVIGIVLHSFREHLRCGGHVVMQRAIAVTHRRTQNGSGKPGFKS